MYKICKTSKANSRQLEFQNALLKMMKRKELKEIKASMLLIEDDEDNMSNFFDFWRERKSLMDFLEKREMSLILIDRFYAQAFPQGKKAEEFNIEDMKYIGWIYALMSVLIVWHHSGMQQPSKEMQEMNHLM